jgi:hypothetical protein
MPDRPPKEQAKTTQHLEANVISTAKSGSFLSGHIAGAAVNLFLGWRD